MRSRLGAERPAYFVSGQIRGADYEVEKLLVERRESDKNALQYTEHSAGSQVHLRQFIFNQRIKSLKTYNDLKVFRNEYYHVSKNEVVHKKK
jgi:hypothetical protein